MSIVENIKFLCKQANTTIPKIGVELGFGNGAIYNWDKNSPSIEKVQKIAEYFNVSLDKVIYGFELTRFEELVRIIKGSRSLEQFAKDTGLSQDYLDRIIIGINAERPDVETIEKIVRNNPHGALAGKNDLLKAAGYINEIIVSESSDIQTIAAHHDGEDWTEEELESIEKFKQFVRSQRKE